jgi:glutaredoxin
MSISEGTRVYLKKTCPFCLKFRIFLTEAQIADRFEFTVFDDGDETHKSLRTRMEAAGREPSFPAVEAESGTLITGTDDLIARFAKEAGIEPATLPLLRYYSEGVFARHIEMFRELRQLKGAS